jgi:hypothetical protein
VATYNGTAVQLSVDKEALAYAAVPSTVAGHSAPAADRAQACLEQGEVPHRFPS